MAIATARARDRPHAECDQEDRPPLLHPAPVQVAKVVRQQHSADDDEDDAAPTHANLTRSIATGNGRSPPKRKSPGARGFVGENAALSQAGVTLTVCRLRGPLTA